MSRTYTHLRALLSKKTADDVWKHFQSLTTEEQKEMLFHALSTPKIVSILHRKLHKGKTYAEFKEAWKPPRGAEDASYFPVPVRVLNVQDREHPEDIYSIGLVWLENEKVDDVIASLQDTETTRRENIAVVSDKIGAAKLCITLDDVDLGH